MDGEAAPVDENYNKAREKFFTRSHPLSLACQSGFEHIALFLINEGCDVNACNDDGSTAIATAAAMGMIDVVKLLLEKGADIVQNMRSQVRAGLLGRSVAATCIFYKRYNVLELLLAHAAAKGIIQEVALPALAHMIQAGPRPSETECDLRMATMLASADGLDLDQTWSDFPGKSFQATPLLLATHHNHPRIAKMLVEQGADVNKESWPFNPKKEKWSPLHCCYMLSDRQEIAKMLVANGATIADRYKEWLAAMLVGIDLEQVEITVPGKDGKEDEVHEFMLPSEFLDSGVLTGLTAAEDVPVLLADYWRKRGRKGQGGKE